MIWTEQHDTMLCCEIMFSNPFTFRKGSQGRGKLWQKIAESLNPSTTHKFCVDDRGVRERYNLLKSKHKGKMSKEIKASGISPEESEYTKLITEVIDLEEASTASLETGKKVDMVLEREKAEDIRLKAMESLAETKKRKELNKDDEEEEDLEEPIEKKPKRFRRNANETLSYLKTKNEIEVNLRREEMAMKKEIQENEANKVKLLMEQQQQQQQQQHMQLMQYMGKQQQQQQQQQMQMQQMTAALLQQQQQQNSTIMAVMQKFLPQQ